MRQKRSSQHIDPIARHELVGHSHGIPWVSVIVAGDKFNFFTIQTASRVDLLDREFHTFFVGLKKSRLGLIAIDFADFDDALRQQR